jgi:hypothetical protein
VPFYGGFLVLGLVTPGRLERRAQILRQAPAVGELS